MKYGRTVCNPVAYTKNMYQITMDRGWRISGRKKYLIRSFSEIFLGISISEKMI